MKGMFWASQAKIAGNIFSEGESQLSMSAQFIQGLLDRLFILLALTATLLSLTGYLGDERDFALCRHGGQGLFRLDLFR